MKFSFMPLASESYFIWSNDMQVVLRGKGPCNLSNVGKCKCRNQDTGLQKTRNTCRLMVQEAQND